MRLSPAGRRTAHRPSRILLLFLAIALLARLSIAQDTTDANDATTTDDATATATSAETTDTGTSTTDSSISSSTDSSTTSSSSTSSSSSSYPIVTVPPTAGAPYMQTSSTPEGAVFIAVGAVLGFLGLAVLAWRGLVAWSVNRSVRQQAAAMQSSEKRGLLRSRRRSARSKSRSRSRSRSMPRGQFGPMGNMDNAPTGNAFGGGYDRHHHRRRSGSGSRGPPRMREVPGSSNPLFFSPTAGASMHSGKRLSQHHSGYGYNYGHSTASTSTPRASTGPIPKSASVSASERYQPPYKGKHAYPPPPRARNIPIVSPPVSPNLRPMGAGVPNQASPPQGRAPSEYLEDLFDGHARPGMGDWDRR
ncbi:hypothetical protein SI65_07587 [Aspergillus cristatus]|uniref:Uncharacterized protein n=1 Tax=Aspergillus cristatus TaxID=573508 RepID=A0A1E3B8I0_ASPCR|nr:hypothetical protein SI65_07587 [Aspergillus cristatus]